MSEVAMFFQQAWHKTKCSVACPAAKHGASISYGLTSILKIHHTKVDIFYFNHFLLSCLIYVIGNQIRHVENLCFY